jgi:OmpA-OmpF porin, OOP family
MSPFDNIIEDAASRFGLGAKAGPLLRELLTLITGSGGISAFMDKFKSAGLSREVDGWLGHAGSTAAAATSWQVEQALGTKAVDTIAQKVGVTGSAASTAIGYLMPKVIGQLTPGGVIGSGIPSSVTDFLRTSAPSSTYHPEYTAPHAARASANPARWIAPLLALAALAGLGWYFLSHETPSTVATTSTPASVVPSRLAITNDNGVITYSGTVRDQASRDQILDMLKNVYGANAIKGNIVVDPNAAPTPWLANLRNGLEQMKMPGLAAVFEGTSFNLGGTLPDADRDRILASLKSIFGASGLTFAAADRMSSMVSDATNRATAALAGLGSGFRTPDLLVILNKSIINFPTGSAEIPPMSLALLQEAAKPFKQLPAGTVIEIGGYTDNTGDAANNVTLSQHRAEAVRNALIQFGVSPAILMAKGYGSGKPVASNDTPEGRFQNRRIEYQMSDGNRVTEGSAR